jgi:integrase
MKGRSNSLTTNTAPQEVMEAFKNFCKRRSKRAMSPKTLDRYGQVLDVLFRKYGLQLDSIDLTDLERIVTVRAQTLAPATFNTEMAVLRRWCEFHHLDPRDREVRDVLQFKKATPTRQITDSDILSPDDIISLIQHLRTPAWKALIAIMWDTGCRIGEICGLDYEDVTRDEHGFMLHIRHSKTMKRKVRLITPEIGLKYFTPYYVQHQGRGPLFQTSSGSRITSDVVRKILSHAKIGKHLGKRVWPTLFRKSASTYWKKTCMLPDPAIRQRLGHSRHSRTFEQWYLQYGDDSQKVAELAALGKYTEVAVRIELDRCWRCGMDIPATEDRCMNCHAPASGKTLQEDVREKGELDTLKFELKNIEVLLEVLLKALSDDPMLKSRISSLARKGIPPFIDLLDSTS